MARLIVHWTVRGRPTALIPAPRQTLRSCRNREKATIEACRVAQALPPRSPRTIDVTVLA